MKLVIDCLSDGSIYITKHEFGVNNHYVGPESDPHAYQALGLAKYLFGHGMKPGDKKEFLMDELSVTSL